MEHSNRHDRRAHAARSLVVWTMALASAAAFAQDRAWVGNFRDGTVSVVDTRTAVVTATIAVGRGPHGMAASADGRRIFVALDGDTTVAAIDTASGTTASRIDVGRAPHGLALLPDGKTLLVAVYGEDRVAWVDLATDAVVATAAVAKPHTIAVDPAERVAYVASQDAGDPGIAVVDLATRTIVRRVAVAKVPRDLESRFDGRAVYFTMAGENAVQVLDPASERVVATIATGSSPHLAALYRGAPSGLVVVQGPGELLRFDPATGRPGTTIRVGDQPHWMAPFDGGRAVAVTNEGADTVSLVDLGTGVVRTVAVGQAPRKVVTTGPAVADRADAANAPADAVVSIRDFAFGPARTTVAAGASVAWTNDDGAPHGLAFDDGSPGTELLFPGRRFTRRFDGAATVGYHCTVHPYMTGSVTVSDR